MHFKNMESILERRLNLIRNTLNYKAAEYAQDTDRFHNFRIAARISNTTMEKALKGMMLKHEVSVQDMVEDPHQVTEKMIDEKIGDCINYLILLEGVLKERIYAKKNLS